MITYFHRNPLAGISIGKVSSTYINEIKKTVNIEEFTMPMFGASFKCIITNLLFTFRHRNKHGINHITGDIHYCMLGLIGCKSVLTIHDTVFLTTKQSKIKYFIKWILWLYIPCLLANKIVCISEKTKNEVIKHNIIGKKISIIYDPVSVSKVNCVKKKGDIINILHVGTKKNKNLLRVIESLNGLRCHLTIVGYLTDETVFLLKRFNINYSNLYNISESELSEAYQQADIVSFPSTYEGFGMPIIEGQLAGCAILTSKIAPMTEVGQDSVLYVDPYNVNSINNGFESLITNSELRMKLVMKGKENVKRFLPDIIANQYLKLYETVV